MAKVEKVARAVEPVKVEGPTKTTETKKVIEYVGVNLPIFSSWTGDRVWRDIRKPATSEKLQIGLPIPETDDVAKRFYGLTVKELTAHGVRQWSYDQDTSLGNLVKERDFSNDEDVAFLTKEFETDLMFDATKTRKARVSSKAEIVAFKKAKEDAGLGGMSEAEIMRYARVGKMREMGLNPDIEADVAKYNEYRLTGKI